MITIHLKSRWILIAFSMSLKIMSGIVPIRSFNLFLSTVRIWFVLTLESPEIFAIPFFKKTSKGYTFPMLEVIGRTVTVSANSLLMLFEITTAGLVFPISDP